MTTASKTERTTRAFALQEVKALDSMQGVFEGYLAVFGNEDFNGDVIEPGAFTKTLKEAQEVKQRDKRPWQYPLLWMHEVDNPVGGFDATVDQKGLYIKGQCDMDTEIGRRTFSGMVKGYMRQLSIGYEAIKAQRDQKGVRHLLEAHLFEGSAVTTGYAANGLANVVQTKLGARGASAKAVGGKTSWPLAARDRAWDNGAAHNRIVAWATGADDKLDEGKLKSVHFWYDSSATDKLGSYKLLFCDVVNGDIQAIPRGIMACTGSHGIQAVQGVSSGDMSGIKSKIKTYYNRMAKEFNDDSIVVPWEQGKRAWRRAIEQKQWGGLQTLTRAVAAMDYFSDDIATMLEMLGDCVGMALGGDVDEGAGAGDQMAGAMPTPATAAAVQVLLDNLPGLKEALTALGEAFSVFDSAGDTVLGLLGMQDADQGYSMYASAKPILELKTGAAFSQANKDKIVGIAKGVEDHMSNLRKMVGDNVAEDESQPVDEGGSGGKMRTDAGSTEPGSSATTPSDTETEPELATLLDDFKAGAEAIELAALAREARAHALAGVDGE